MAESPRCLSLMTLLLLAICPGCAMYSPTQIWRYNFDYNTERALSAQWTGYDHLPPKPVRMRITKWAYNVGPSPIRGDYEIPAESPVAPVVAPPVGVLPGATQDLLDQARPPTLLPTPPLPPQPSGLPSQPMVEPYGPTAAQPSRVTHASWVFSGRR